MSARPDATRWLRPVIDYGPLAAFFVTYLGYGLFAATAALMAATAAALVLSLVLTRRVPRLPLVTAAVVGVFGGLTLGLDDPAFIKMKPTIVQGLFAAVLLGGLAVGKPLLQPVLGAALPWRLSADGWRRLTRRWALFFATMAGLNEVVWRSLSTDAWVGFKVFGILGLTMAFAVAQLPLLNRHRLAEEDRAGG